MTHSPFVLPDPTIAASSTGGARTLYLVRHASPDWTRHDLPYHIPPGPPLTEQGQDEARLLRDFLRRAGVRRIASSPLERCLQTAHLVADPQANGHLEVAIPLDTWPGLMELQPGEPIDSIRSRFCSAFQAAWDIAGHHGPMALVTHGGPITFLLEEMGMDGARLKQAYEFDHHNPLPPAGTWQITRAAPNQPWKMALVFIPADLTWQSKVIETGSITPELMDGEKP